MRHPRLCLSRWRTGRRSGRCVGGRRLIPWRTIALDSAADLRRFRYIWRTGRLILWLIVARDGLQVAAHRVLGDAQSCRDLPLAQPLTRKLAHQRAPVGARHCATSSPVGPHVHSS